MAATSDRLDLRLSPQDKDRLRLAAALDGVAVAAFVRRAALREAEVVIAHPRTERDRSGSLAARLRGRATTRMSTEEIMRLTRGT